eukprot:TCALIF_08221-PA protein Name:"Similar to crn Protein crooked neck (Drosophila melanogaster)" AED:0.25 eAED:0.25 QI:58/0.5/0.2/0.8/0.75/0.6/5/0/718
MSEGAVGKGGGARPPKVARVKNKAPAELQITAEQLLREAKERQLEIVPAPPKQTIADAAELADFQMRKRKSFEDAIRKSGSQVGQWMKYAGWEEAQKGAGAKMRKGEGPENGVHIGGSAAEALRRARSVYERALDAVGPRNISLWIKYAEMEMRNKQFEENQKEHDRARVIYKYALDLMPKDSCVELYKAYTVHEKKFGERAGIETVILKKRKLQYEAEIAESPMNYDAWFDLIRLTMSEGDSELVRETFERAIANIPPSKEKQFWRRYIYLWINYAVFEELEAADMDRARQVYLTCLEYIPHKKFTFAKVWLLYAQFEIRQKNVRKARLAMGTALGKCPKAKLFRGYIDLEIQLREFERCRTLYEKFLLFDPENCSAWMKFAELEALLGDVERARGIYELAVNQPRLDMPELLWKAYIDFENDQEEFDKARQLYRALLNRTQHVKVWLSFAQFELGQREDDDKATARARRIYEEANNSLREVQTAEKEPRVMLLEAWREFEREHGEDTDLKRVMDLMPRRVKKRRKIETDNESAGWEEYFDYIFPEDESAKPNLKLLAMAKMWKKQKEMVPSDTPAPPLTQTPKTTKTSEEKGQEGKEGGKKEEEEQSQETTNATANPDADDEDMKNESSSDEEDEDAIALQTLAAWWKAVRRRFLLPIVAYMGSVGVAEEEGVVDKLEDDVEWVGLDWTCVTFRWAVSRPGDAPSSRSWVPKVLNF